MNWACGTCGEEKCIEGFGRKTLKATDHLEDMSVDEIIILKWILKA